MTTKKLYQYLNRLINVYKQTFIEEFNCQDIEQKKLAQDIKIIAEKIQHSFKNDSVFFNNGLKTIIIKSKMNYDT